MIFVVISILVVIIIYSPSATFGVDNKSNDPSADCAPTGKQSANGLALVECCWEVKVPPGTGWDGSDTEWYCSECEDGGTRGKINCSEPYLEFIVAPTPSGPFALPEDGVFEQPPTSSPSNPAAPLQGGILEQLQNDQPPLFGRNVPLQGFGVFGQQPAAIVPPSPVLTPVPPVLTPEPPVPMFGSTQQQATPTPPSTGDDGLTGAGQAAPLTDRGPTSCPIGNVWDPNLLMCVQSCPIGNVWDPNLMICIPDLPTFTPPQLCPDGSIPQSTGPGGILPECPPFEAEQPSITTPDETPPSPRPPPLRLCPDGSIPQPAGSTQPRCPPFEAEQPSITTPDETPPSPLPPPLAGEVSPEAEIAELQTQDDEAAESDEGGGEEPPAEQP
jgi:hypothetical protein